MKVSAVLVVALMAFQANALFNSQKTETKIENKGGKGGNGGDVKMEGGNGGDAAKSKGGKGGDAGDASGGQGSNVKISADHKTQGGQAGPNTQGQSTDCYGSCVTYSIQGPQSANGGAATDSSQVNLKGPIGNTDSRGGSSTGGDGGHSQAKGNGGKGNQQADTKGGKGGDGNKNGDNTGGSSESSDTFAPEIPLPFPKLPFVRRYAPGAYDERNAGVEVESE